MEKEGRELKEARIRSMALSHYSRKDVLDAIYKFSKNREVSPRYFEGFGKRPDSFQYPSDISSLAKRGATSFHCSEELWQDPLEISMDLTEDEIKELRKGWDVVIDIDCQWIDYSKKAALAIVRALENKGVKNIGVKFSGGKGFHIIIPWKAFPEKIDDIKTSDMFPEWPRSIVNYLKELSRPILENSIKDMEDDFSKVKGFMGIKCKECNNLTEESYRITVRCEKCSHIETFKTSADYKERKCPTCRILMPETEKEKFYFCSHCDLDSLKNKDNFSETPTIDIFKLLGLDVLLVSPRHLFRMPYSLHEKTSMASIVIPKDKIKDFNINDAHPLNIKVIDFYPTPKENEARNLLLQAIDFQKTQDYRAESKKIKYKENNSFSGKKRKFEKIDLTNVSESNFPPPITKILKGMQDGRKRALFILLNFFRSLGMNMEAVEKRVTLWNKLNKPPIKKGYINAQLLWHSKHSAVLPPNFDNEVYKAIDVYEMDDLSRKLKNPISYVVRKSGAWKTNKKKSKKS